jgi:hypothetical protein
MVLGAPPTTAQNHFALPRNVSELVIPALSQLCSCASCTLGYTEEIVISFSEQQYETNIFEYNNMISNFGVCFKGAVSRDFQLPFLSSVYFPWFTGDDPKIFSNLVSILRIRFDQAPSN